MPEAPGPPWVDCFVIEASKFFYGEQDENGFIAPNEWKDRSQSMGWGLAVGAQLWVPGCGCPGSHAAFPPPC